MVEFIAFMIMVGVFLISRVSFGEAKALTEKHRDAVHGLELEICNLNFTVNLQIYELGVASVEAGNLKSRIEHLQMQMVWVERNALDNLAFARDLEARCAMAGLRISDTDQGDLLWADECDEIDMDEYYESMNAVLPAGWDDELPF